MADNKGNKRIGSFNFDAETKLEVMQRGGGGAGVGGENGLAAINLVTGESTNDALAEKDETIEEQAATIEEQEATIETQAGTISDLEDEVAAKQAIIDAFPTIEALNVTANGTYNEEGKAYKPVTVNVPESFKTLRNFSIAFTNNSNIPIYHCSGSILANALTGVKVERTAGAGGLGGFFATKEPAAIRDITILCEGSCTATVTYGDIAIVNTYEDSGFTVVTIRVDSNYTIPDYNTTIGGIKLETNTQP